MAIQKSLSIVAPCYNEEDVLDVFLERTHAAALTTGLDYEIILVDDGSADTTWEKINVASDENPKVVGIQLFRNHGHQLALSAGLKEAKGFYVVAIDADLQDPPELMGEMISLLETEEADVVYGKRRSRAGETRFKLWSANLFYSRLRAIANVEIPANTGDFRLMTREVVDVLNAMPERHRFLRGMVAWIGGKQIPFYYDRDPRYAGVTKYTLDKMIRFSLDAITAFSRYPLTLATYIGVGMGLLSLLLGMWSLFSYFLSSTTVGWSSLMTVLTLQFALIFFFMGVIGEYVGRIFETNQGRPLYTARRSVGVGLRNDEKNNEKSSKQK